MSKQEFILYYVLVTVFIVFMRMAAAIGRPIDCEFRYVDIVFPLSRIACPVDWNK